MIALTKPFPGNSSRTRTQAISVPNTTLISATTSETPTVITSASIALRSVMAPRIHSSRPEGLHGDGRQREQDDQAQPQPRHPDAQR